MQVKLGLAVHYGLLIGFMPFLRNAYLGPHTHLWDEPM
jgi:uncharacterized membrane protein YhiD involved in acid resistance